MDRSAARKGLPDAGASTPAHSCKPASDGDVHVRRSAHGPCTCPAARPARDSPAPYTACVAYKASDSPWTTPSSTGASALSKKRETRKRLGNLGRIEEDHALWRQVRRLENSPPLSRLDPVAADTERLQVGPGVRPACRPWDDVVDLDRLGPARPAVGLLAQDAYADRRPVGSVMPAVSMPRAVAVAARDEGRTARAQTRAGRAPGRHAVVTFSSRRSPSNARRRSGGNATAQNVRHDASPARIVVPSSRSVRG
jgi:hypothetical protein